LLAFEGKHIGNLFSFSFSFFGLHYFISLFYFIVLFILFYFILYKINYFTHFGVGFFYVQKGGAWNKYQKGHTFATNGEEGL
jgi:hypothetical protein